MPLLSRPHFLKLLDEYHTDNPRAIDALLTLVTRNLGFQLFREIEQAKIRLSAAPLTELKFNYADVHIRETLTRYKFADLIAPEIAAVETGVRQILREAALGPDRVDVVLRTGGTSAVPAFSELLAEIFDRRKIRSLELLTSVVGGLAIAAHEDRGYAPAYDVIYPQDPATVIGGIRSANRQDYVPYEFRVGRPCYLDFPYSINRMPVALSALPAIRLAQTEKEVDSEEFLHFRLSRPATLYIAYDADAKQLPNWLAELHAGGADS